MARSFKFLEDLEPLVPRYLCTTLPHRTGIGERRFRGLVLPPVTM
jgi:hypothetical protein